MFFKLRETLRVGPKQLEPAILRYTCRGRCNEGAGSYLPFAPMFMVFLIPPTPWPPEVSAIRILLNSGVLLSRVNTLGEAERRLTFG